MRGLLKKSYKRTGRTVCLSHLKGIKFFFLLPVRQLVTARGFVQLATLGAHHGHVASHDTLQYLTHLCPEPFLECRTTCSDVLWSASDKETLFCPNWTEQGFFWNICSNLFSSREGSSLFRDFFLTFLKGSLQLWLSAFVTTEKNTLNWIFSEWITEISDFISVLAECSPVSVCDTYKEANRKLTCPRWKFVPPPSNHLYRKPSPVQRRRAFTSPL